MDRLLERDDPEPVLWAHQDGASPWLLVADHAGNAVPAELDGLGLDRADLEDHIGIDIGIWPVTLAVGAALGAPAIGQAYSRLVIDCNRRPGTPASIPAISDGRTVPANAHPDAEARRREIFDPYHRAIAAALPGRSLLCAMHSFTRTLAGHRRTVDVGVIHGPDARLADGVLAGLGACGLSVGRNVPYAIDFAGDYTLPVHAEGRLPYVELEICQDLIGTPAGQARLSQVLAPALAAAQASLA